MENTNSQVVIIDVPDIENKNKYVFYNKFLL